MTIAVVFTGLNPMQADGLACIACEANYLEAAVPHGPAGRSHTGSQVFVCQDCPINPALRSPGAGECVEGLGVDRLGPVGRHPEVAQLVRAHPGADADVEPATGELACRGAR